MPKDKQKAGRIKALKKAGVKQDRAGNYLVRDRFGVLRALPELEAFETVISGGRNVPEKEQIAIQKEQAERDAFSDTRHGIAAFGQGILSGQSLGVTDFLFPRAGEQARHNPFARAVGEVTGAASSVGAGFSKAAGGVNTFGKLLPQAAATRASTAIGSGLLGEGRLGALALEGALDAGIFNVGRQISDAALGNSELTAETLGGAFLSGATLGGAGGVLAFGIGKAVSAAKTAATKSLLKGPLGADSAIQFSTVTNKLDDFANSLDNAVLIKESPELATAFRKVRTDFSEFVGRKSSETLGDAVVRRFNKIEDPTEALDFAKRYGALLDETNKLARSSGAGQHLKLLEEDLTNVVKTELSKRFGSEAEQLTVDDIFEGVAAVAGFSVDTSEISGPGDILLKLWALKKAGNLAKKAPGSLGKMASVGLERFVGSAAFGAAFKRTGSFPVAEAARATVGRKAGRAVGDLVQNVIGTEHNTVNRISKALSKLQRVNKATKGFKPATRVSIANALALFDFFGEGSKKSDDAQKHFDRITAQLAKIQGNPQSALVRAADLTAGLSLVGPEVAERSRQLLMQNAQYLAERMPRSTGTLTKFGVDIWKPTQSELHDFGKLVRAVVDPVSIIEDFANGTLHPIAARVLKDRYPEHFLMVQRWVVEHIDNVREWPYSRQIQTGYLFDTNAPHPLLPQINSHQTRFAEARAIDEQRGQTGQQQTQAESSLQLPTQLTPAQQLLNR